MVTGWVLFLDSGMRPGRGGGGHFAAPRMAWGQDNPARGEARQPRPGLPPRDRLTGWASVWPTVRGSLAYRRVVWRLGSAHEAERVIGHMGGPPSGRWNGPGLA